MRDLLRPSLVVGVVIAVVGTALLFVPSIAAAIPGNESLITVVGLTAFVGGALLVYERRRTERAAVETGDPEVMVPVEAPGTALQDDIDKLETRREAPRYVRRRTRKRLYEAAVAVVRRRDRVSEATAQRRVDAGKWTDDAHAARFLGDPDLVAAPDTREDLPALLSMGTRFAYRTRRTARAILDLAEGTGDPDTSDPVEPLQRGPATDDRQRPFDRETNRWLGIGGLALVVGGIGIIFSKPAVLLLTVVGVAYAAFAFRARPPTPDLAVERSLTVIDDDADDADDETSDDEGKDGNGNGNGNGEGEGPTVAASVGDRVRVTLTVANAGDEMQSDLRLVDGVPPGLEVIEGSPRLGTALRPGRTATFSYVVEATRGDHAFEELQVLARDGSGANERELAVPAPGRLTCIPDLESAGSMPLYGAATRYTGRVATETGGEGVEFYSTREYRPGDPPGRIDWNRHARTRELATLLFREEQAATVLLLVDTRKKAYRAGGPGERHAAARNVDAAGRLFESLLAGGDRVGLASFGPHSCWIDPGAGGTHRERVRRALATDPAFGYDMPDEQFLPSARLAEIRRRAPVDAQFVLLSPMTDDYIETVARRLQAHGFPVTVVSPDATAEGSLGHRLARVERQTRLNSLREADIRVVDWGADEDLRLALERASTGWSA